MKKEENFGRKILPDWISNYRFERIIRCVTNSKNVASNVFKFNQFLILVKFLNDDLHKY